ncbi:hypothetical protein D918_01887 [Trichuris suis]|nr:hypothetical protein D918_01887 [Trichuris suis]
MLLHVQPMRNRQRWRSSTGLLFPLLSTVAAAAAADLTLLQNTLYRHRLPPCCSVEAIGGGGGELAQPLSLFALIPPGSFLPALPTFFHQFLRA